MGHPLRWFEPGAVYEITSRTIREQFQLRPCDLSRDLILGVLGRAQFLYPGVNIHYFVYLSNHVHLLLSSTDGESLATFLGFVNGNVARVIGRFRGSPGPLWGRRMRPIRVVDEESMVARLRYLLSQGCKEGLVASPGEWPGASAYPAFVGDMVLYGTWHDQDGLRKARRAGRIPQETEFAKPYPVELSPLPAWADLDDAALRDRHRALVDDVTRETTARNLREGRVPLGVEAVRAMDPTAMPRHVKRGFAPLCHAATALARELYLGAYRTFVSAYRRAAAAIKAHRPGVEFPVGAFPRGAPFVSWPGVVVPAGRGRGPAPGPSR